MTKAPDEIDAYIGARLKMRRQAKGMSQEQLGHEIGLTFQQVQKYEKGLNRIGAGRLFHIAEVLGVDVGFFYEGLTRQDRASDGTEGDLVRFFSSSEGRALARAFSRIDNPHTRSRLIELVRTIAESDRMAHGQVGGPVGSQVGGQMGGQGAAGQTTGQGTAAAGTTGRSALGVTVLRDPGRR